MFRFESGEWAHAILSKNGRDKKDRILQLHKQYGEEWLPFWLTEEGHANLAKQWQQGQQQKKEAA